MRNILAQYRRNIHALSLFKRMPFQPGHLFVFFTCLFERSDHSCNKKVKDYGGNKASAVLSNTVFLFTSWRETCKQAWLALNSLSDLSSIPSDKWIWFPSLIENRSVAKFQTWNKATFTLSNIPFLSHTKSLSSIKEQFDLMAPSFKQK